MKGSIQSLPADTGTGQIDGMDGATYVFYLKDFSPEDIAFGLEEMQSVEFDPVPGDVNRAMHCVRLRAESENTDALVETESAGDAPEPAVEKLPPLYSPPVPGPLLCKRQLPPEWEIISVSDWCVRGSSINGSNEAQRIIAQRARELKANAILDLEYGIVGAESEGSTTHFFQGRLAVVGKRDPNGKPPEMLAVDLNKVAKGVLSQLELRHQSEQLKNYALYAVCVVVTLMVAGITGFASLPTMIVGLIAVGLSVKLTKDTALEAYVILNPIIPPTHKEPTG